MGMPVPNHCKHAVILEWTDGDTLVLDMDLDYEVHLQTKIRLLGLDAPEKRTDKGKLAWHFAEDSAPAGTHVIVVSHKNDRDDDPTKEKYGRWLADIWLLDGTNFNLVLVATGHAVPYNGGKRQ